MISNALRRLGQFLLDFHAATMQAEYDEVCRNVDSRRHHKPQPSWNLEREVEYLRDIDELARQDIKTLKQEISDLNNRLAKIGTGAREEIERLERRVEKLEGDR